MNRLVIGGALPCNVVWSLCCENGSLCQSEYGYRIKCNFFDCEVFVLTDCPEFNTLDARLRQEGSPYEVEHSAIELILKYKSADEIVNEIYALKKKSYKEGYRACQSDMRSVLGLTDAERRGGELL